MKRLSRGISTALAVTLLTSGCYGSFNLTRQVYHWNGQVQEKWPREFMFLILTWVPIYGLAGLGDAIIFNSLEFWQGKNPVEAPPAAAVSIRRLARSTDEAVLAYAPISKDGQLLIEQFRDGQPAPSVRLQRRGELSVGTDRDGRVVLTAQTLADGGILIRDSRGKQMAVYPADHVATLLGSDP